MISPQLAALLSALLLGSFALELSREYAHGPIPFDDSANLYFTIDRSAKRAYLAVKVLDQELITSSPNWIGIGVSEPTSGSMLGSDVVTAEFRKDEFDECEIKDRYVPFVAYPIGEPSANASTAFPEEDECQDDGSWTLVRCERSVEDKEMLFEVSRGLDAHDDQDREIMPGLNNIIYAYGASFQYHGARRASLKVRLYEEDGDESLVGSGLAKLPDDVDGNLTVTATGIEIPSNKTTVYACTSQVVDLQKGEKRMIVAAEPVLNATDISMVHHLILYLCRGKEYAESIKNTIECSTGEDNGISGPLGSAEAKCTTFVFGYAKGSKRLVLPKEAGILIEGKDNILVMETHYDNPSAIVGEKDNSGVRLFYTETMREHEAGSLLVGDSLVQLFGEKVKNNFEYEFTCPSECTKKFSRAVNVYGSFLHMHTTGKEIYNNRFSENGSFIENVNKINFWSDSFQGYTAFDPPKQMAPGDQLAISCLYDTTKRAKTVFGLETTDEMCMDFIGYWPVQRDPETGDKINICAFGRDEEDGNTFTFCGDVSKAGSEETVLRVKNPKFEDKIGAPTSFGEAAECGVPDPSQESSPGETVAEETSPEETSPDADDESEEGSSGTENGNDSSDGDETAEASPDENVCFPGVGRVSTRDGEKRMEELGIGDTVHVGGGLFSEVFMFTHKMREGMHNFVSLETESGATVALTDGHYIYANGKLVRADTVGVGDMLRVGNGSLSTVTAVKRKMARGLYNPQTVHGDIVVDGVVASTYTKTVAPGVAHGLLVPLRWMYLVSGLDCSGLVL